MNDRSIDVGIITIIPTEIEALLDVFNARSKRELIGSQIYFRTSIYSELAQRYLDVVISFSIDQGNTESAITTTKFLHDWYPRIMCLVGIAAGIRGKTEIGDIIVPSLIHDYSIKTYRNQEYNPRSKSHSRSDYINTLLKLHPLDQRLFTEKCCTELSDDIERIIEEIKNKNEVNNYVFNPQFRIHDGNLVSDNVLIRDDHYFDRIVTSNNDKCQGGDMESSGFVRACQVERLDFPWIVVRGVSDYGDNKKIDMFQSIAAKSASVALRELLTFSINIDELKENPKSLENERNLQFDIIKHIREAYENEDWKTVCVLGTMISRYLYLSSQYDLSIDIGKLVEDAAVELEDDDVRAKILIEDIGWTQFVHGEKKRAKANISTGLTIAEKIGNYYLSAKAYRHLASIERRKGNYEKASENLSGAEKEAKKIPDEKLRREIQASLVFSRAKLKERQIQNDEDLEQCIEAAKNATKRFIELNDQGRAVKTYRFIGDLYCRKKDYCEAIKFYNTGLEKSFEIHRYDTIEENGLALIGIADYISLKRKIDIVSRIKRYCEEEHLKNKMIFWNRIEKGFINEKNNT